MKRLFLAGISVMGGITVTVVGAELALRMLGHTPSIITYPNEPAMLESHPVRGWQNKPGRFVYPPYHSSGQPITMTILESGQRQTSDDLATLDERPKIVFIGGSFVQGWAISDWETFAWKIQERLTNYELSNFGTAGYGTYQSLLLLEEKLPTLANVAVVVYGYVDHHDMRNTASLSWLATLDNHKRRGHITLPYATVENGILSRHRPQVYVGIPFRQHSALLALFDNAFLRIRENRSVKMAEETTNRLLIELNRLVTHAGARFGTIILSADEKRIEDLVVFATDNNIALFNCHFAMTPDLKVPGERHPNGVLHALWADCIAKAVIQILNE